MNHLNSFLIKGTRLELRRLVPEKVSNTYLRWMNDPEVVRFTESRHRKYILDDLRAYVKACNESGRDYLCGIFELNTGLHIGNIKVGPIDSHHLTANVGLIIGDKTCWGRGYGTEVICLAVKFAFKQLNLVKLTAGVIAGNLSSQRAFEKNGFQIEGVRRRQNFFEGERCDEILFGLLRDDYTNG